MLLSFLYVVLFIYLFGAELGRHCCMRFSLVVASGGYSLAAVGGFLAVVASLVVEYGLWGMHASVVVAHGLSSPQHVGSSWTRA